MHLKLPASAPVGGVELLECVGFQLGEEGGEIWAAMEVLNEDRIRLINEVIGLLEPTKVEDKLSVAPAAAEEHVESNKIDTKVCEINASAPAGKLFEWCKWKIKTQENINIIVEKREEMIAGR